MPLCRWIQIECYLNVLWTRLLVAGVGRTARDNGCEPMSTNTACPINDPYSIKLVLICQRLLLNLCVNVMFVSCEYQRSSEVHLIDRFCSI